MTEPSTELKLHFQVAKLLREHCHWPWTHIGHGEKRDPITAYKLKNMGLNRGWPDFILLSPTGRPYFIELKKVTGSLTLEQRDFRNWCYDHDVHYEVIRNYRQATEALLEWDCLDVIAS